MEALPFVDTLLKEYLLFRSFTRTLDAFNAGSPRALPRCQGSDGIAACSCTVPCGGRATTRG
jgi:hypothetical protein